MFYREAGDFKTSYAQDNQTFPITLDRYSYYFRRRGCGDPRANGHQ